VIRRRFLAPIVAAKLWLLGICIGIGLSCTALRAQVSELRCKGVITFGDALTRSVRMYVDLALAQVETPDCRKYSELAGYCRGYLLEGAPHSFQFGGAVSKENSKLWADLLRPSEILPATAAGPQWEALRVLFVGRCEPVVKPARPR
jgi:hypothetical protein